MVGRDRMGSVVTPRLIEDGMSALRNEFGGHAVKKESIL